MSGPYVLGLSAFYHDSAAALIGNGELVAAAQEERFTRRKHDRSFPEQAVDYCLREAGISRSDVAHVVFYDKPLQTFDRLLETYLDYAPVGIQSFLMAMPLWLREKLWTRERIGEQLSGSSVLFTEHHEAHAASAFFPSPFESSAILTIDGVGEWATGSYGVGQGNKIDLLAEMRFPHSIGLLYSAFTYYTGFRVNSGEYKVMGLAPYGEPRYVDRILDELIDLREDGSVQLNLRYFSFCQGLSMTNRAFDELFEGPPRKPETALTQRDMDLARSIQDVTEEAMLRMARHVHRTTGHKNLCMAGGVALNCVGNGRILREGPFEHLWIQPAAGDAGGAVGAALSAWHQYLGRERKANPTDAMQGSFLGPAFNDAQAEEALRSLGARFVRLAPREAIDRTAAALSQQRVVGWFQGRMEFGPRALGARSILGDPRSPKMQSLINEKIKFRESFRPFAPSVLRDHAGSYFGLEADSPYMAFTAPAAESVRVPTEQQQAELSGFDLLKTRRSTIPAVTHVDYSARVQTVTPGRNGRFCDLVEAFYRATGCPLVVNTSFNVRGEPIVCTPADAYRCFLATEMDVLVCGNLYLEKSEQHIENGETLLPGSRQSDRVRVSDARARTTALTAGFMFCALAAVGAYQDRMVATALLGTAGGSLGILAAASARGSQFFYRQWMRLASILGRINSRVLLALVFYGAITPTGLLRRLIGSDPLARRSGRAESYWISRETTRQPKQRFERLF